MAEALWRLLKGRTKLLTAIGNDADGRFLADIAPGIILNGCESDQGRTPTYAAVLDSEGECKLGLGDMALHSNISIGLVDRHIDILKNAPIVVLDGNVPQDTIDHVLKLCQLYRKPVFYEPTDRRKAAKCLQSKRTIKFSSPNLAELRAMAHFLAPNVQTEATSEIEEVLQLSKIVSRNVEFLIITLGAKGVLTVNNINNKSKNEYNLQIRSYPVQVVNNVANVSGAGDCFASGFIFGVLSGFSESKCISIGLDAARSALLSKTTVPKDFNISDNENK